MTGTGNGFVIHKKLPFPKGYKVYIYPEGIFNPVIVTVDYDNIVQRAFSSFLPLVAETGDRYVV